jgi:hypothetical protein
MPSRVQALCGRLLLAWGGGNLSLRHAAPNGGAH